MKKKEKAKPKVTVEYEGMGTCIDAQIKIGDTRVIAISACEPEFNDITRIVIKKAVEILEAVNS